VKRTLPAAVAIVLSALSSARATDYFISPTGSDKNDGLDASRPWQTFGKAESRVVLAPGNRLILMDGDYSRPVNGLVNITCGENASNGTSSSHVTIMSQHERRAHLAGDGSADTFHIKGCSFYDVIGIFAESADNPNNGRNGQPFRFELGDHYSAIRNLARHNNRYANAHLFSFEGRPASHTHDNLFLENECYDFFLKCVLFWYNDSPVARRNYANSRPGSWTDLPGAVLNPPACPPLPCTPKKSGNALRGSELISCYPCSHGIYENNVSENQDMGYTIDPAYSAGFGLGNRYYGNISIDDEIGFKAVSRGDGIGYMPQDTELHDFVVAGNTSVGVWFRANKNSSCDHCSVFNGGKGAQGYHADSYAKGQQGDLAYSVRYTNSLATSLETRAAYGWFIEDRPSTGAMSWSIGYSLAFGNATDFLPKLPNSNVDHSSARDPGLGACRLWVPPGAAAKGAGTGGSDIGATILYRYENGTLTSNPLWDPQTGAFLGAGAIVPGINDVAGSSLFDVHTRLNVNRNGCPFPPGYPSPQASEAWPSGAKPARVDSLNSSRGAIPGTR